MELVVSFVVGAVVGALLIAIGSASGNVALRRTTKEQAMVIASLSAELRALSKQAKKWASFS